MEYYQFFVDAWRLFKKYRAIAINSDEYFEALFTSAHQLENRYQHKHFAVDIIVAIVEELKRIAESGG